MNMMFCSTCNKNGSNQMYKLVGNDKKAFQKGFIYPFEIKSNNEYICPYCNNKLLDTFITENEFDFIEDVSDSDRQFLEAMIDLKKKDPIEYQLKMSQFKANLKQQEQVQESRVEENTIHCPYCNSTNVKKITTTSKAVHTAIFGIFSMGRNSKQWHCNDCKSDF